MTTHNLWNRVVCLLAALIISFPLAAFACDGDISGYWEKRPSGSTDRFEVIQEFKIESSSGILTVCDSEQSFNSEFRMTNGGMKFGFRRRLRELAASGDGEFISQSWVAEHEGVNSEYRIRAIN